MPSMRARAAVGDAQGQVAVIVADGYLHFAAVEGVFEGVRQEAKRVRTTWARCLPLLHTSLGRKYVTQLFAPKTMQSSLAK